MIDLWEISDTYTLRLSNVILLSLIVFAFLFGKKIISNRLRNLVSEKGITFKGKEYSLNTLLNQLMIVLTVFFVYAAVGYGNADFSLSKILHYELLSKRPGSDKGFVLSIGQIVAAIFVIFLTKISMNIIRLVLHRSFDNKDWIDDGRKYTIIQMSRYVIYTVCIFVILKVLFGDISNVLLGASALFVGMGLGLQEFFTDVVSGFILLNDGSIKVGDIVELNEHIARVEKINIRTSHVKTTDGKTIIVPNSKFTEEYLTNWSISEKVTRFHVDVSVAYGTDTALVKELLYKAALQHPLVDKKNNIVVMFHDFGDNGLQFQVYFWAKRTWDILIIKSDIRFEIDRIFREHGIKIPFPQRDLHIVSNQAGANPFGDQIRP